MMNHRHSTDWTDLQLEQYLLGEMNDRQRSAFETALAQDNDLRKRVEQLNVDNKVILTRYSPEFIAGQVTQKLKSIHSTEKSSSKQQAGESKYRFSSNRLVYALPMLLLASFALFITMQQESVIDGVTGPALDGVPLERKKGGNSILHVFRKTPQGQEEITSGQVARQGDVIQLQYVAASMHYGMIFSVDGNGVLTMHMSQKNGAVELTQGTAVTLDYAYELDDAPRFEKFYFISRDSSFNVDDLEIENLIEELQNNRAYRFDPGPDFNVYEFEVIKEGE